MTSNHVKRIITGPNDFTVTGRYLSLTLAHVNERLELSHHPTREVRQFLLLQFGFMNLVDQILAIDRIPSKFTMVDSEGFQHTPDNPYTGDNFYYLILDTPAATVGESRLRQMGITCSVGNGVAVYGFKTPPSNLEGHAKAMGWIWFDPLPEGVRPARIIYRLSVCAPGETSGWVQHEETLEFVMPDGAPMPKQLALPS